MGDPEVRELECFGENVLGQVDDTQEACLTAGAMQQANNVAATEVLGGVRGTEKGQKAVAGNWKLGLCICEEDAQAEG